MLYICVFTSYFYFFPIIGETIRVFLNKLSKRRCIKIRMLHQIESYLIYALACLRSCFIFTSFGTFCACSRGFSTQNILQVLSSLSQVILKQVRVLHLVNAKMAWAPSSPPVTKIPIFQVKFFEILVPHFSQLSQQRAVTNKRQVCGATPLGLSGVVQLGQISKIRRKLN